MNISVKLIEEANIEPTLGVEFSTFIWPISVSFMFYVISYPYLLIIDLLFYLLLLASGESQTINLKGIHVDQIKANLVTLDSTKRASATSSSSSL